MTGEEARPASAWGAEEPQPAWRVKNEEQNHITVPSIVERLVEPPLKPLPMKRPLALNLWPNLQFTFGHVSRGDIGPNAVLWRDVAKPFTAGKSTVYLTLSANPKEIYEEILKDIEYGVRMMKTAKPKDTVDYYESTLKDELDFMLKYNLRGVVRQFLVFMSELVKVTILNSPKVVSENYRLKVIMKKMDPTGQALKGKENKLNKAEIWLNSSTYVSKFLAAIERKDTQIINKPDWVIVHELVHCIDDINKDNMVRIEGIGRFGDKVLAKIRRDEQISVIKLSSPGYFYGSDKGKDYQYAAGFFFTAVMMIDSMRGELIFLKEKYADKIVRGRIEQKTGAKMIEDELYYYDADIAKKVFNAIWSLGPEEFYKIFSRTIISNKPRMLGSEFNRHEIWVVIPSQKYDGVMNMVKMFRLMPAEVFFRRGLKAAANLGIESKFIEDQKAA